MKTILFFVSLFFLCFGSAKHNLYNTNKKIFLKGDVLLSHKPGIYDEEFDLKISYSGPENIIFRYTTNCDEVNESSTIYTKPIHMKFENQFNIEDYLLTKKVIGEYSFPSAKSQGYIDNILKPKKFPCVSHSNVINLKGYLNGKEAYKRTLNYLILNNNKKIINHPILFLNMNNQLWFNDNDNDCSGYGKGLYNCFLSDNAYRTNVAYFDYTNNSCFEKNSQIKIGGAATRGFPQKTINFNLKKDDKGEKQEAIKEDIFEGRCTDINNKVIKKFKRFRIWNRGDNYEQLYLLNDIISEEVGRELKLDVATSTYRECSAYFNGEYWGQYFIREKISTDFIESHFGVGKDNIVILKQYKVDEGDHGDVALAKLNKMFKYLEENNLNDINKYNYIFDEFIDKQSLLDWYSFCSYCNQNDFIGVNNNDVMWISTKIDNSNKYSDGKFRFALYDMDTSICNRIGHGFVFDKNEARSWHKDRLFKDLFSSRIFRHDLYKNIIHMALKLGNLDSCFINKINILKQSFLNNYDLQLKRWGSNYSIEKVKSYYEGATKGIFTNRTKDYLELVEKHILKDYD